MEFLEAAKKLIAIDTSPSQGNLEAVKFLSQLANKLSLESQISEEISGGVSQANIFIRPNQKIQKILLQTHLDTIDPGSFALWNKTGFNPYQASIRGDKIYGLGAADVKLDFLCKLFAMSRVDWKNRASSAVLLGTFGEEEHMRGAIKAIRDRLIAPTPALIGEPTDLHFVCSGKGIAQIEIIIPFPKRMIDEWAEEENTSTTQSKIFQGRAAHSSAPELGENAVEKMLEYLLKLPEGIQLINVDGGVSFNTIPTQAALEFDVSVAAKDQRGTQLKNIFLLIKKMEQEFKKFPDKDFEPPHPTINLGVVRTLTDHIRVLGAVRWSSHIPESQYQSWMLQMAEQCKEQKAVFRVLDVKRPFATDKNGDFLKLCNEALASTKVVKTQPVTNEANVFSRFGFECVVFGPGQRQNNTHTPEEHVSLGDLKIAEDFYFSILKKVCL